MATDGEINQPGHGCRTGIRAQKKKKEEEVSISSLLLFMCWHMMYFKNLGTSLTYVTFRYYTTEFFSSYSNTFFGDLHIFFFFDDFVSKCFFI